VTLVEAIAQKHNWTEIAVASAPVSEIIKKIKTELP